MIDTFQAVGVTYGGSTYLYTYLVPTAWNVEVGDEVRRGRFGSPGRIESIGRGDWTGAMQVMTEHFPKVKCDCRCCCDCCNQRKG